MRQAAKELWLIAYVVCTAVLCVYAVQIVTAQVVSGVRSWMAVPPAVIAGVFHRRAWLAGKEANTYREFKFAVMLAVLALSFTAWATLEATH